MILFSKHTLSNGLRLLHHFDATTQMVALNLIYDVGSRDENENRTGLAHLFEHLMFGGSSNAPQFDDELQRAGGSSNAWTSNDVTNYYEILPAHNVETAFWLESDRLLNLTLSDEAIAVQKSVVIEEFKQRYLNRPYGDLPHLMSNLAFTKHPYRWPVIGKEVSHIAEASNDEIRQFFHQHYSVDNMVMCVSGNVTFERAVELTEKWFGDIERRQVTPRNLPEEPRQTEARVQREHRDVPENVLSFGFHMCGINNPDYFACDLLSDVLSNGRSSRFYRNLLLKTDIFSDVDATISGRYEPGLFNVFARLRNGVDLEEARHTVETELQRLVTEGVEEDELRRYANKYNARELYESVGYDAVAEKLCQYELLGDANRINLDPEAYYNVTVDDFNRVAGEVLRPDNCSLIYYGPSVEQ